MNGRGVRVHETASIANTAVIIGDVSVGKDASVLPGATLRGDSGSRVVVGERTNVQEGACLHVSEGHDTIVGQGVTIGHGAIVHGCTVGDNTLIGMGAIILDGARVGANCIVGAGSLVTGGKVIPDGMLALGSPAKPVRQLTSDEVETNRRNADEYVHIGRELAEAGHAVLASPKCADCAN
ncbi:gamma carbonic anhydrase family protein [Adlercreutzia sp. ZJ141]|uniref:gamma carbonic anhydrase family protein n=1 Tax=Adlercreutzia sp. ZJ141 TaxID=2709406 RepID=UPI0013EBFC81|nr:gamma carbonic anhydrase family protein [Adlercreutzia sp. ZJ141]